MMGQNKHMIEIVMADISNNTNKNQKKSFVVPGHQQAHPNDVVTWEARDSSATFFFPKPELFGKKEYRVEKGEKLSLTVSENAEQGRHYPYAVFTDNDDFAEGGSFPRIIIR